MNNIRNFCILAHIDHGKSTLADRFLELTGTVEKRKMREQFLDMHPLEREKGITIKMQPVRMAYQARINAEQNADKRGLLYEDLTYKVRGALFNVYNQLGPAFKETVYQKVLAEELQKAGLSFEKEKAIDVVYCDKKVGVYRPDFIVDGKIIIEIKALPFTGKLEKKQTWYYLKGSQYRLALLVNFGSSELQIERIVYDSIRDNPRIDPRKSAQVEYILNLIDPPGHVDFSYEVSRALACVEVAILLVDATKGVQAQTIANLRLAEQQKLVLIPVINKIDLPSADVQRTEKELVELFGTRPEDIFKISAKTGEGVVALLQGVIERIPPPAEKYKSLKVEKFKDMPLRALVFDSKYDAYLGIIAYVRIFEGELKKNDRLFLLVTRAGGEAKEVGVFSPLLFSTGRLGEGEIGYVATGVKEPEQVRVGDTLTIFKYLNPVRSKSPQATAGLQDRTSNGVNIETSKVEPLPGYREPTPMVFASVFPERQEDYDALRDGLSKLKLEDGALFFEPEDAAALGRGMRVGFLGMLHMEIVSERLKREYGLSLVFSTPSVAFRVRLKKGGERIITSAMQFPEPHDIESIEESWVEGEILTPPQFLGALTQLLNEHRVVLTGTESLGGERLILRFQAPLREIIVDFYDELKSVSHGFASMSYTSKEYRRGDFARLDIAVVGESVPAFAVILPREDAYREGRKRVERLKELLPRELFAVALQAVVEGQVIARETVPALKKDVTGYLYGGDRTRKMKLWKKRLKSSARVAIAPDVFLKMLKPR